MRLIRPAGFTILFLAVCGSLAAQEKGKRRLLAIGLSQEWQHESVKWAMGITQGDVTPRP